MAFHRAIIIGVTFRLKDGHALMCREDVFGMLEDGPLKGRISRHLGRTSKLNTIVARQYIPIDDVLKLVVFAQKSHLVRDLHVEWNRSAINLPVPPREKTFGCGDP
jgi:hypothetical protein